MKTIPATKMPKGLKTGPAKGKNMAMPKPGAAKRQWARNKTPNQIYGK